MFCNSDLQFFSNFLRDFFEANLFNKGLFDHLCFSAKFSPNFSLQSTILNIFVNNNAKFIIRDLTVVQSFRDKAVNPVPL